MNTRKRKLLTLAVAAATAAMAGFPAQAYESPIHVFSIDDVQGGFDGSTFGPNGVIQDGTILCIAGVTADSCPVPPLVDRENVVLYPIDSEFGFEVVDFLGARAKVRNNDYQEGFAGNILDGDTVVGVKISNAATDTYKVKPPLGTWCQGLGGNSVKCSSEHYTVMEHVVSCHEVVPYQFADPFTGEQQSLGYPDDPDLVNCADAELDNQINVISNGVPGGLFDPVTNPMLPNDNTSVLNDIAASSDYSITLKDDGKVLYRWGSLIKRPNDVRLYARIPLPEEWKTPEADFVVNKAELHVTHWITNNPNDQLRPEDLENEGATGRTPDFEVIDVGGDEYWVSTRDCFEGDGDFISGDGDQLPTELPAGTVFKNSQFAFPALAANPETQPQNISEDLSEGFTNAFYTTTNRDPFEWSYRILDSDGNGTIDPADERLFTHVGFPTPLAEGEMTGLELVSGPRWRLKANKFGQDIPGLEIPLEECSPPPFSQGNKKYEVGELVTTVINLLDWEEDNPEGPSPLVSSKGWVDVSANDLVTIISPEGAPPVTSNGLPLTDDFDLAVYIKGDRKPTALLNAKLVLDYEGETPEQENELFNGSARAQVGDGVYALTGGFVIDGSEQKCVVIRGRGPSVNLDTGKLEDPTLKLMVPGSTAALDFNDNWQDHPSASTLVDLGLAPASDLDAAIYTCLNPGAYTFEVAAAPDTALGLGMFEVVDVDQSTSRLVNIAARAEVGEGVNRVVSGFIIHGDEPREILIRGRGPSMNLATAPTVEDTFIELWSGSDVLAFNDNWGDADNAAEITATGRAPTDALESAILMTLEPGAYTVRLQSVTAVPGIGILEVLDLTDGTDAVQSLNMTME